MVRRHVARLVLSGLKSQRHQVGVMFRSWAVVPVHLPINLPIALIKATPFLPWVNLKGRVLGRLQWCY